MPGRAAGMLRIKSAPKPGKPCGVKHSLVLGPCPVKNGARYTPAEQKRLVKLIGINTGPVFVGICGSGLIKTVQKNGLLFLESREVNVRSVEPQPQESKGGCLTTAIERAIFAGFFVVTVTGGLGTLKIATGF